MRQISLHTAILDFIDPALRATPPTNIHSNICTVFPSKDVLLKTAANVYEVIAALTGCCPVFNAPSLAPCWLSLGL